MQEMSSRTGLVNKKIQQKNQEVTSEDSLVTDMKVVGMEQIGEQIMTMLPLISIFSS